MAPSSATGLNTAPTVSLPPDQVQTPQQGVQSPQHAPAFPASLILQPSLRPTCWPEKLRMPSGACTPFGALPVGSLPSRGPSPRSHLGAQSHTARVSDSPLAAAADHTSWLKTADSCLTDLGSGVRNRPTGGSREPGPVQLLGHPQSSAPGPVILKAHHSPQHPFRHHFSLTLNPFSLFALCGPLRLQWAHAGSPGPSSLLQILSLTTPARSPWDPRSAKHSMQHQAHSGS